MNFKEIDFKDINKGDKVFIADDKNEYIVIGIGKEGNDNTASITRIIIHNDKDGNKDLIKGKDKIFIQA